MSNPGSADAPPPDRLSRVTGALLGVHAGDSLGATVEFASWARIRAHHPRGVRDIVGGGPFGWRAGAATDDTDLTRAVLLAYRDMHDGLRPRAPAPLSSSSSAAAVEVQVEVGEEEEKEETTEEDRSLALAALAGARMLDWLEGRWPGRREGTPPADAGGATRDGLAAFARTRDPLRAGAGAGRAGNGSLMRCVATALFQPDGAAMVRESLLVSGVTHDDARCGIACAAYNAIVRALVAGEDAAGAVGRAETLARGWEGPRGEDAGAASSVRSAIARARHWSVQDMAERGPTPEELPGGGAGFVLESLSIAVAAVLDTGRTLEETLIDVVRIGRDTDTNAAIAGGLLGARDGATAIPERWRKKLQYATEFVSIAQYLMAADNGERLVAS